MISRQSPVYNKINIYIIIDIKVILVFINKKLIKRIRLLIVLLVILYKLKFINYKKALDIIYIA